MPYLEILRAWLPAGVATFWSDCRGRQCLNKVFPSSQKLCCEVEGFNMVQHGSTTFCSSSLPQLLSLSVTEAQCIRMCCCGKWSEWSNETFRVHNLAHRILLSACAHCRALLSQSRQRQWVWACLNNVLSRKLVVASLIFFMFFLALARDVEQSNCQTRNLSCTLWYGFISSSDPPNSFPLSHSTPPCSDHLATFLHATLRISLLIASAHGFLCLLRSHIFFLGLLFTNPQGLKFGPFPMVFCS